MAHADARHRKPRRSPAPARGNPASAVSAATRRSDPASTVSAATRRSAPSGHRKQAALKPGPRPVLGRAVVAGGTVLALGAAGGAAVTLLPGQLTAGRSGTSEVTDSLGIALADSITTKQFPPAKPSAGKHAAPASQSARHTTTHRPRHARPSERTAPTRPTRDPEVYLNPLRNVSGLIPERIDMGVDFGGSGPVYAIGDGVVTNATGVNAGWPGGGWITYQLTDGPAAGLVVYVAEDVTPTVSVGQRVTPETAVANMYNGGAGIETGWAMPDGASALSQLSEAGGIGGAGPFPTLVGNSFEDLLTELGVPAANNAGETGYGVLPAGYLTSWLSNG
jgi:hypothetical protein